MGTVRLGRFRADMVPTLTYLREVLRLFTEDFVIGVNERRLYSLHRAEKAIL